MGSLRAENQKQNIEIASLKETVDLQNKTINQHEAAIKELTTTDDHKMIKKDHPESSTATSRHKRPARLLPSAILRGRRRNETENDNRKIFYGPPTDCSDLTQLGYTLNGFYIVNKPTIMDKAMNITKLETTYCAFKQEGTYNPTLVEKPVNPSSVPLSPMNPLAFSFLDHLNTPTNDVYFLATMHRLKSKIFYGRLTFHNTADGDMGQTFENMGKSFNGETGYFTATRNGIYHFFYETLYGGRGNGARVDFYLNEIIVPNPISFISDDDKGIMSIQVTLKLKTKDTICLKVSKRDNIPKVSSGSDIFSESITGVLLKTTIH